MKRLAALSSILAAWLFAAVLHAAPINFFTTLTGPDEFPPVPSPGTGSALVVLDPVAHTLRVVVQFQGLLGVTTASHIHCCVDPSAPTIFYQLCASMQMGNTTFEQAASAWAGFVVDRLGKKRSLLDVFVGGFLRASNPVTVT